ncbi:MAG: hypothetical protein RJQ07_03115 [Pseudomonadales bacterium]
MAQTSVFMGREMENASTFLGKSLGSVVPEDEFLHVPKTDHYAESETFYYGFCIPEEQINAEIYIWFHPSLKSMSAGVLLWKGIKRTTSAAEYVNYFQFLPMPESGVGEFTVEAIGMSVKVVKPLESVFISLKDPDQDVSFQLTSTAIMPPAVRPDSCHFTQAMRTTGELTLYGERFAIDSFFSRDHSWGHTRTEQRRCTPPLSWTAGVINENLAFHSLAFDDPGLKPSWLDGYSGITSENNLVWGYLFRDGKTLPLKRASQLTHRDEDGISVSAVALRLVDIENNVLDLEGTVQARLPWNVWQNNLVVFGQIKWTCRDGVGYGDVMDNLFSDFPYRFMK